MMKVGDIVRRKRRGGTLGTDQSITSSIGLVIKDHREKGAIAQFYVQFDQRPPKWFYQHDLSKV